MVGINIREMRKRQGMTQEALAQEVGVTQAAVTQWETGKAIPSVPLLIKLAKTLKCSMDVLVDLPPSDIVSESEG